MDWFMTVLRKYNELRNKLRKKYKEMNLLVKKKQSIKPWQYMHIFNSKKVTRVGKITPTNIIFYTHTILLLVIYSTDKQTAVIKTASVLKLWSNFKY